MAKYRKKPVVIEADQWTGDKNRINIPDWLDAAIQAGTVRINHSETTLMIDTLEGTHKANQFDWIIQGVKGELYPCKPDIFDATYEAA